MSICHSRQARPEFRPFQNRILPIVSQELSEAQHVCEPVVRSLIRVIFSIGCMYLHPLNMYWSMCSNTHNPELVGS